VQAMHGTMSYHFTSSAAASNFLRWDSQITGSPLTLYTRVYCYFTGTVPTTSRFMQFNDSSATLICGVGINGSDQFVIRDTSTTIVGTSSTVAPANQWFRIELMVFSNATTGQATLNIYTTPDSTIPAETLTVTSQNLLGNPIAQAVFGNPTAVSGYDLYMDDIAVQDSGFVGPAITSTPISWTGNP